MQEVISAAFDSPDAIDARFIPNLYVGVGEFFGVRVKCYMKDFVQNADAILNGDSDYFRGLHNIEIETYMKGADYESTYQKSCAAYIWLRRHSEEAELRVWACWHRMHRCNQAVARLYREKRRRELSGVGASINFRYNLD